MPDMKDRKGKKSKTKQAMSEPVDLEAGDNVAEPETPTVAKAIYDDALNNEDIEVERAAEATDSSAKEPLDADIVTDNPTPAAKGAPKTQRASIPPPPKAKAKSKVPSAEAVTEATQDENLELSSTNMAVPDAIDAEVSEIRKQEELIDNAADVSKTLAAIQNPIKTKAAGRKILNEFPQAEIAAKTAKDPTEAGFFKADTVKNVAKTKLQLIPLASGISITPQPLDADITTKAEPVRSRAEQKLTLAPLVSAWSFYHEPLRGSTATREAQPETSSRSRQRKAAKSQRLPSLSPFDHKAFSRFDNLPTPTANDYGKLIMVQIDEGIFSNVHRRVLCQNPHIQNIFDYNLRRFGNPNVNTLRWPSSSGFNGLSSIYIHWLYNSNLPTAVIDVSTERKVGVALLRLADEYVLGHNIYDGCYQNAIMDAFITLHVRMRWLTFCSVIEVVYYGTPEGSQMRQMLDDMHAFIVVDDAEEFDFDLLDEMPKAFVVDVLESVVALRPNEVNEWWHFLKKTEKTYYV